MNFFSELLNCSLEDVRSLVIMKANELENSESTDRDFIIPNESSDDYGSFYRGFIKKSVRIYDSMGAGSNDFYTMGEYDYLIEFFEYIKKHNINTKTDAIKHIAPFLEEYFGKYVGEDVREDFIRSLGGNIPIDAFKGKGLAACAEKAAITNNILSMLGIDSFFLTGEVNGEQHAFNVIQSKGSFSLIDSSSCCGLYDRSNNLLGCATYIYSLGRDPSLIEKFLTSGEPIRTLDAIARFEDGSIRYEGTGTLKKYEVEPIKFEEKKEISKKN